MNKLLNGEIVRDAIIKNGVEGSERAAEQIIIQGQIVSNATKAAAETERRKF